VIAHRGASGHRPEHTSLAYRLAWRQGADSVETDVVSTRDGVLVCRHDLDLSRTTDVADRPDLAARRRTLRLGGKVRHGWWVHDFDLAELRTLRARERWPEKRPLSARYDGQVGVVTLEELLAMREEESGRAGRPLGVHVEVKHAGFLASQGLPVHEPLAELLRTRGLASAGAPAAVMSFEPGVLRRLRERVDTRALRLFDKRMPVRRRTLAQVREYAEGVGLHKHLALPRTDAGRVAGPGKALTKSVEAGLDVLVWTLRNENRHLPAELRVGRRGRVHGDAATEVSWFLDLGVDGVITDFPDVAVRVRRSRDVPVAL
jgi:glycerophosphoryl diester phosphodiesterase